MKFESRQHDIIKPKLPSPAREPIALCVLDQISARNYITFVLLFAPPQDQPLSSESLKKSLSGALSVCYPLAGRYRLLPGDKGLELECNDRGVDFFEASMDEKLESFEESRCNVLCPCGEFPAEDVTEVPLLLVQLTRFKCGGWSLGVAMHHNVGDGAAMDLFMKTWSHFASGGHDPVHPPCFDRSFFNSSKISPALEYGQDYTSLFKTSAKIKPCMFRFTSSQIQVLKNQCDGNYTRFEVLAAHIWKYSTKLRKKAWKEAKLVIPVDGRTRLPGLPKEYFGNATFSAQAIAQVDELVAKPLSFAAKIVHDAIQNVSGVYIGGFLDWIQQQHNVDMIPSLWSEPIVLTSWTRFSLYELEFGCGTPVLVTSPGVRLADTVVFLPWSRDGTMTVVIQLGEEERENLLASPEFLVTP
ncbi:BAHD family acyltransferase [Selaginella moellendorffii]|uniref:BAHD family acyltransferase n=1 Tax=Selaginella moellendorffii TaxID=88036 RepID=D8S8F1_SELML|nr:shikimate O-hydroxycinnamoyltransferase [Selaginella moellendorffii]EFJ19403.1 BAHD family acyltransferase [Selaginella moellendorffii]|eukprot:XP_002979514.1 shikimate O-hydroxycinnamoyltransferase [Selaginella moellendorffii]